MNKNSKEYFWKNYLDLNLEMFKEFKSILEISHTTDC